MNERNKTDGAKVRLSKRGEGGGRFFGRAHAVLVSKRRNGPQVVPVVGARDWYRDLLLSTLFRACIKLQTQMDRHFRRFRMTAQEAAVLVRCVDSKEISPGALARAMARDKGKVTRFIQRLVARDLLKREGKSLDRRVVRLRPTNRGRAMAPDLKLMFDGIRDRFFEGTLARDIERVGKVLTIMLANANRNGPRNKRRGSMLKAGVTDSTLA